MSELKPCPFCGDVRVNLDCVQSLRITSIYYVICSNCRATAGNLESRNAAIQAWNKRANECTCDSICEDSE